MKKRQFKKSMKKKFENLKVGQGLIISNKSLFTYGDYHCFEIGSVVDIISLKAFEVQAKGVDKDTGYSVYQYLKPEHILVK